MKLRSFGCSFTYGTDLDRDATHGVAASRHTWPALLARNLGLDYECMAWPGIGNLQILERVMAALQDPDPCVYVINWTWIDRFDYQAHGMPKWLTIRPNNTDSDAQFFYRNLHSQHSDQLRTLSYMTAALNLLQQRDVSYIMTCIDDLVWDTQWSHDSVKSMQQQLRNHCTWFDGKNFLQWSQHCGHAVSDNLHPLHAAHRDAVNYVTPLGSTFRTQKTV